MINSKIMMRDTMAILRALTWIDIGHKSSGTDKKQAIGISRGISMWGTRLRKLRVMKPEKESLL